MVQWGTPTCEMLWTLGADPTEEKMLFSLGSFQRKSVNLPSLLVSTHGGHASARQLEQQPQQSVWPAD